MTGWHPVAGGMGGRRFDPAVIADHDIDVLVRFVGDAVDEPRIGEDHAHGKRSSTGRLILDGPTP